MAISDKTAAAILELNISYMARDKFYGPPQRQLAWGSGIRKVGSTDFRPEYKWQEPTHFSSHRKWSKR